MSIEGVLVVGATGTQGGAVARRLVSDDRGIDVYALTRDPNGEAARDLAARGATVVEGDLFAPGTLVEAMAPVDAVFAMTDYWDAGFEGEVTQGINQVNAAARSDLDHVVFSSVAGASRDTGVPMLEAKARIESHVRAIDLPATILRPNYFMQNFELRREDVVDGTLALPLAPGTRLPLTDARDLGRLVARVLDAPERFRRTAVPLAGETLTLKGMAAAFGGALDRKVEPVHVPLGVARSEVGEDYAALFEWYNTEPLPGLAGDPRERLGFTPRPLAAYLEESDWTRPAVPAARGGSPVQ